jgi:flavin reductase (DIM6/NTAB) family NADH-FMN oxidoreductase RutF
MHLDPKTLSADETYKLLTGVVVPRPIAWVTTLSPSGGINLAPFSTFTFVSPKPPMLAFSVGQRGGVYKDTARNALLTEEYVVHIADRPLIGAVHESAVEHPPEISEVELLGLATEPSLHVKPPRIAAAPIAMECRLRQCLEFGETRSRLIVGEVVAFHFRDGLMQGGKIDTKELDPVARLAGPNYATLGEVVAMRPIAQSVKTTVK